MTGAWLGTPVPGEDREIHRVDQRSAGVLHVDCDRCAVRGAACAECVISVLLGPPDDVVVRANGKVSTDTVDAGTTVSTVDFDTDEQAALAALAGSGLVPPLRLVTSVSAGAWSDDVARRGDGYSSAGARDDVGPQPDWDDGWGDGGTQDWA